MRRGPRRSSARIVTAVSAVFDASVLIGAAVEGRDASQQWLRRLARREVRGLVPDLVWAEVANGFAKYVRAGALSAAAAVGAFADLRSLPFEARPLAPLAAGALPIALARGLTAYDACYVVLAEASDAVLVTADRRLAGAAAHADLIA
jgi:predicted nucleic acid-binding protein